MDISMAHSSIHDQDKEVNSQQLPAHNPFDQINQAARQQNKKTQLWRIVTVVPAATLRIVDKLSRNNS